MSSNIKWTCILEQGHRRQRQAIASITNRTTICRKVFQRGDFMTKITQWFLSVSLGGAELLSQTPAMSGRTLSMPSAHQDQMPGIQGLQQQCMLGTAQRGSQAPRKLASEQTEVWRWHRIDLCLPQGTADPIPEVHSGSHRKLFNSPAYFSKSKMQSGKIMKIITLLGLMHKVQS